MERMRRDRIWSTLKVELPGFADELDGGREEEKELGEGREREGEEGGEDKRRKRGVHRDVHFLAWELERWSCHLLEQVCGRSVLPTPLRHLGSPTPALTGTYTLSTALLNHSEGQLRSSLWILGTTASESPGMPIKNANS